MEKSEGESGCWLFTGSGNGSQGYGWIFNSKLPGEPRGKLAHRAVYEHLVGPIPDGLVIDHLCRVRRCVNPSHMEPVTQAENVRRGAAHGAALWDGIHWTAKVRDPEGIAS